MAGREALASDHEPGCFLSSCLAPYQRAVDAFFSCSWAGQDCPLYACVPAYLCSRRTAYDRNNHFVCMKQYDTDGKAKSTEWTGTLNAKRVVGHGTVKAARWTWCCRHNTGISEQLTAACTFAVLELCVDSCSIRTAHAGNLFGQQFTAQFLALSP